MNTRFVLTAAGVLALSSALYVAWRHAHTGSHSPLERRSAMAAVAPSVRPPVTGAPRPTPGTNQSSAEFDLAKNPYAASLREPSKSKRAWDARFLRDLQPATIGQPIHFELTDGVMASGTIQITQYREGELTYISGELDQPERGKFFILTPLPGGKAGKAAGVIEFPASQKTYRIEPTGPNGDPELWQRRLDEVLCQRMPPVDETMLTNESVNIPPLRPDTVPDYIPSYNSNIVSLQSYPGSAAVLLLDFFGGYTPTWGGVSYPRPNVSNAQIKDLWKRVAEDFMAFNINVTTDLRVYQNAPISSRQKCVFTDSSSSNPLGPGGAGVAYIGSWNWGSDTVCWSGYSSGKAGGEVGAHEPGHTLGLGHETTDINGVHTEYFTGQGSGATGWAPIMGAGYYQPVTTWSKGEFQYAGNLQDEINVIVTQNNNVSNRVDDTGNTLATSRYLEIYAGFTASAEGAIERAGDTDAFQFTTTGGQMSLTANPVGDWANLAVMATLADGSDTIISSNNPQTNLFATITTNLPAGTYTFRVTGAGRNSPLTNGFSAYSSLGYYSITGSVAGARLPTRLSVAEHAPNGTLVGTVPANNVFGGPLAYAIRSGNTGNTFSIDATGAVWVASNTLLDYYRLATNTMLPVQFELLVNITNLANSTLTELNRRVVIAVLNVNDAPLVVGFTNSVLEHSQPGLPLGTVTASNPDFFESLTFSLVGGNTGGAFSIDQYGFVTVAGDLNAASQNIYNLQVAVSDNTFGNPLISTGSVTINVLTNATPFQPGTISYAVFDNIGSSQLVSDLTNNVRFPTDPTFEKQKPTFEGDSNRADNYGAVMRGYLIPPVSGSYTFWIATDDNGELWMSTSTNPVSMSLIAYIGGAGNWASPRQWTKYASQQSAPRSLVAGQGYYIEARMKEGSGGDNIAVAWKGPATANLTNVIPGQYLAPRFLNYVPHLTGLTASVRRDTITGARVALVGVTDVNTNDTDSFAILSGNTDGIFTIDNAGWLRIADETALQATATPSYTLTVQATDSGTPPLSVTTTVTLNITEPTVIVPTAIQREMFYNIGGGTAVSDLTNSSKFPGRFDALVPLSSFASPVDVADNYGSRIRGLVTPASSGSYTFFIASDDNSQLLLSSTASPANASVIASVPNWTAVNTWTSYAQQKSAPINLVGGQSYYIEALQKEGGGGDHVEVAWAGPGILDTNGLPATNIIASSFLTPVDINSAPQFTNQTFQVFDSVANGTLLGKVYAADSLLDTLSFKLVDGNTNNMFALAVDTGWITVVDNTLITNGTLATFALTVLVQDSGCGGQYPLQTAQATITINVVNSNNAAFVWTGGAGTNNWGSSGNWGGALPGVGTPVFFGYPAQQTNLNDFATAIGSVQFTSDGFCISGNPLTLQSGLTNLSGNNTWGCNTTLGASQTWFNSGGRLAVNGSITNAGRLLTLIANNDIQLKGPISGAGGVTKSGTGRLLMQGAHTYSGTTVISAASGSTDALLLAGPNDLDVHNSDLTLNGRMDLDNYNATIGALSGGSAGLIYANDLPEPTLTIGANGHSGTFAGVIQNSTVGLGVTLAVVKTGSGTETFSGNNTFTGGLVVNRGLLTLSSANGSSPAGRGVLTINTGATVNATADNQLGLETSGYLTALNIAGGTFNAWNYCHVNSITMTGGMLGVTSGASQVDGMDLRAFGSANPVVSTLSSVTTATIMSRTTLNAPATFDIADGPASPDLLFSGAIVGGGSLSKIGAGTLSIGGICTYTGGTLISAGVLQIGTGGSVGFVNGNITNNASLVFNRSGTLTVGSVISGAGSLTKTGSSTLTLAAANTFRGPTIINQGTLALGAAGSIASSSAITLQAGATLNVAAVSTGFTVPAAQTLAGNGTVSGNVLINGIVSPGASPGGLSFSGNLALAGVAVMEINKAGATLTNDSMAVSGALTYGGALLVTNTGSALAAGDAFPLFTAGSFSGWFTNVTLPALTSGLHWATNQLALDGTLRVALPTPPQILPVSVNGANLQLSIQSEFGVSYILQTTPSLAAPAIWTSVSTNSGTGSLLTIPAPIDPAQPQCFFRFLAY